MNPQDAARAEADAEARHERELAETQQLIDAYRAARKTEPDGQPIERGR